MKTIIVKVWNLENQKVAEEKTVNVAELDSVIDIRLPYKDSSIPGCKIYLSTGEVIRCAHSAPEIYVMSHAPEAIEEPETLDELEKEINHTIAQEPEPEKDYNEFTD